MTSPKTEMVVVKKLKKGGVLNSEASWKLIRSLSNGNVIAMPVDCHFGYVGASDTGAEKKILELSGMDDDKIIRVISSFKMLEKIAIIDKFRFDFLHRIWPGDVVVKLKRKVPTKKCDSLFVLTPRNRYILEIVETIRRPVLFVKGYNRGKFIKSSNRILLNRYKKNSGLILIIDELCKEYPSPTILDLSGEELVIMQEGKISTDEIKSLYFLDKV
jgi:tRNA A37 threonylcarbamoyladenosine synthetase subunit TsaC/SUA5/YrdC